MATEQDRAIGRAVAGMRGELSQSALADRMRERGWKWSQATVWAVEQGERPLRLAEAADLAVVLKGSVDELLRPPSARARLVRALVDEARAAFVESSRWGVAILGYHRQLAEQLQGLDDNDLDDELLKAAEDVLKSQRLDDVAPEARRWRERTDRGQHF